MTPNSIVNRLRQYSDLPTALLAALVHLRNSLLYHRFHFAKWHIAGTYYSRPYHRRAVKIAGSLNPQLVVEIGAGLGDIISRCPAGRRVAFDSDRRVIEAANLLHHKAVEYYFGQFTEPIVILDKLHSMGESRIDLLILINWIHEINFERIKTILEEMKKRCVIRWVLIDTINPSRLDYQFHHSIADLESLRRYLCKYRWWRWHQKTSPRDSQRITTSLAKIRRDGHVLRIHTLIHPECLTTTRNGCKPLVPWSHRLVFKMCLPT